MTQQLMTEGGIAYVAPHRPDPAKPWALLCHGAWLQGECWTDWRRELETTYNVLTFDVPGYGRSPLDEVGLRSRGPYDWSGYILSLLDEVRVQRAFLIGESTGGAAVLHAAATAPERVLACAICSTPYRGDVLRPVTGNFAEVSATGGIQGLADYMLENLFLSHERGAAWDRTRRLLLQNNPAVPLHDAGAWRSTDFSSVAGAVRAPVLILAPGQSAFLPRSHSLELERLLPNPWLALFGRAGHYFTFVYPRLLAGVTREFFDSRVELRFGDYP